MRVHIVAEVKAALRIEMAAEMEAAVKQNKQEMRAQIAAEVEVAVNKKEIQIRYEVWAAERRTLVSDSRACRDVPLGSFVYPR